VIWTPAKVRCDNCKGSGGDDRVTGGRCGSCGGSGKVDYIDTTTAQLRAFADAVHEIAKEYFIEEDFCRKCGQNHRSSFCGRGK